LTFCIPAFESDGRTDNSNFLILVELLNFIFEREPAVDGIQMSESQFPASLAKNGVPGLFLIVAR